MKDGDRGRLVIISGPSGAGKSTVVRRLLDRSDLPLTLSVSATTRQPRAGEVEGKDYFFLSEQEFHRRQRAGEMLECKEVFGLGCWYGTLREQVATGLDSGKWVILEIDVQGAVSVIEAGEYEPITIFIHPGGMRQLEDRLRSRGTESEQAIRARLQTAKQEMEYLSRYQFEVINETVDVAVAEICQILNEQKESNPCSKS